MSEWNFFDPASKDNLVRVIEQQSDRMIELATEPEAWERPTACGHWEVRDVIGHLVDTTDSYLRAFAAAEQRAAVPPPLGLAVMSEVTDEGALEFRSQSQDDVVAHLVSSRRDMLDILKNLGPDAWSGQNIIHRFMGPLPAAFFAAGQVVDYAVHSWDIVEGTEQAHALDGDAADLLVPFSLIVWQHTAGAGDDANELGLRISGRNAQEQRISVGPEGTTFEPGELDGLETVLEFDAASFVLTAFGRINGGTCTGDTQAGQRFLDGFLRL